MSIPRDSRQVVRLAQQSITGYGTFTLYQVAGVAGAVAIFFSSFDIVLMLSFALIRLQLQYASFTRSTLTCTDAHKFQLIQLEFFSFLSIVTKLCHLKSTRVIQVLYINFYTLYSRGNRLDVCSFLMCLKTKLVILPDFILSVRSYVIR